MVENSTAVSAVPGVSSNRTVPELRPDSFAWPGLVPPAPVESYLNQFTGISGGRFDESFTVYDQPLVMIFENVGGKSAAEMRAYFPDP